MVKQAIMQGQGVVKQAALRAGVVKQLHWSQGWMITCGEFILVASLEIIFKIT